MSLFARFRSDLLQKAPGASPSQEAPGASLVALPYSAPRFRQPASHKARGASLSPHEAPGASPVALPHSTPPLRQPASHKAPTASLVALPHSAPPLRQPASHKAPGPVLSPQEAPGASLVASFHNQPCGFTLVELLLVIGIIGLLTAISVPIVMQSLAKARNAAIKAEIDMLHMAIMNYKNEYGSFPPCKSPSGDAGRAAKHIRRLFPRTANLSAQVPSEITPNTALVEWLSGFSNDPTSPRTGERVKLFDFDESRKLGGTYFPSGRPESNYIYMDVVTANAEGLALDADAETDTFQILCAGRDGILGDPGADDDLSNIWPGTRREYLDSLKN